MAMPDDELANLEKLLKKARQKPLAYGLCLGKKPEDNVLYLDLKKSGEVMMRKAKADGETGKVTYGEASVSGKILTLMVQGKMLPGLAKNMKAFMTKQGMKMKVVITDPSGNELESDGDEDDEENVAASDDSQTEETAADDSASPADGKAMAQWTAVHTAMGPHVTRFVASGDEKSAAVSKAWAGAEQAAEKGDYKSALAVAAKIKPLVTAAPGGGEDPNKDAKTEDTDPDKAKWEANVGPISTLFTAAMGNNPANRTQLEAAWAMANEKAEAGDYKTAMAIAAKLKPALESAAGAAAKGQDTEVPKDVVPFQKSRVLWVNTRAAMKSEMKKLQDAITNVCGNDEELAPIVQEVSSLSDRLEVFDTRLEDVLDQITNTPEGDKRTSLKREALTAIEAYQTALQDPFFKDVDNNNGFANVAVSAAATKSLASIAKVLAA